MLRQRGRAGRECPNVNAQGEFDCVGFQDGDTIEAGRTPLLQVELPTCCEGLSLREAGRLINAGGAATVTHLDTGSLMPTVSEVAGLVLRG